MNLLGSEQRRAPARVAVAVVVALGVVAALSPGGRPAAQGDGAQGLSVTSPTPQPESVVEAGDVMVSATVAGSDDGQLEVDGEAVDGDVEAGIVTTLQPGGHRLAVRVAGEVLREWTVYAADIEATQVADDPLAVGLAASGTVTRNRPVVLVNADRPELSLSGATVARSLAAAMLPVVDDEVSDDLSQAIGEMRDEGQEIILIGGLDAIGDDVAADLETAGYTTRRVGSGSAAQVAAAAAEQFGTLRLFVRGGGSRPRSVVLAPVTPLPSALEAAAFAAANDATLLLVEDGEIEPATQTVLDDSPYIMLAEALPPAVQAQVRDARGGESVEEVDTRRADQSELWVVDAETDPSLALMATRSSTVDVGLQLDSVQARRAISVEQTATVTAAGIGFTARDARAARVDGPQGPVLLAELSLDQQLTVDSDREIEGAGVAVTLNGVEWPGRAEFDGTQLRWIPGTRPSVTPEDDMAITLVTGVVSAGGHLRHFSVEQDLDLVSSGGTSAEGFFVAGGTGDVVGESSSIVQYTVEIEPGTGLSLSAVAAEVESILSDVSRGWTARGIRSLQRVSEPGQANIRVVVARPGTVDTYCGRVGLATGGQLSCWDGRRAMLNLNRWNTGVSPFHTDLTVYRQYLVNHEFGHGLGFSHVTCPQVGTLAPVMSQQSKGLGGCVANGWPYPNGR